VSLLDEYKSIYEKWLVPHAEILREILQDHLTGIEHIDSISVRAKSPSRFVQKSIKKLENSDPKYLDPLTQIQDQIGARIVVFYKSDVEIVSETLSKFFRPIEAQTLEPDETDRFAYMGQHFIFYLPTDIDLNGSTSPFFELQIKTLFQHAWAEASHDIAYKQLERPLNRHEERLIAFAASQSWGADNAFAEVVERISRES